MDLTGWYPWSGVGWPGMPSPYDHAEVEVWREGWPIPVRQKPGAAPEANAVGLYWRPLAADKASQK